MELTYDWRSFQAFFQPRRKSANFSTSGSTPIYLVIEGEKIICAFCEGEDLSEWIGSTYQELASQITHRELMLFNRDQVDRWMQDTLSLPHFYDQNEYLKKNAMPQHLTRSRFKRGSKGLVLKSSVSLRSHQHFLLEALQGGWLNVMPSVFGLFIRLEKPFENTGSVVFGKVQIDRELFLIIRRGKIDHFCEPDLSVLGTDRLNQPADVVKYLSEKYLVPVQGLFVSSAKWNEWAESENPWSQVALALRGGKNAQLKLVPGRWGLRLLIQLRSVFGV